MGRAVLKGEIIVEESDTVISGLVLGEGARISLAPGVTGVKIYDCLLLGGAIVGYEPVKTIDPEEVADDITERINSYLGDFPPVVFTDFGQGYQPDMGDWWAENGEAEGWSIPPESLEWDDYKG